MFTSDIIRLYFTFFVILGIFKLVLQEIADETVGGSKRGLLPLIMYEQLMFESFEGEYTDSKLSSLTEELLTAFKV
jgi:hypothetical protein